MKYELAIRHLKNVAAGEEEGMAMITLLTSSLPPEAKRKLRLSIREEFAGVNDAIRILEQAQAMQVES